MKTETWVRLASIGITAAIALFFGYVVVRYFAGVLLPFALAALVASILRPASQFLGKHLRLPRKLCGTLLILGAVSLLSFGIVSLGRFLYASARDLIASLPAMLDDSENPLRRLMDLIEKIGGAKDTSGNLETLYSVFSGMIREAVGSASAALTAGATSVIMGLPRLVLSLVVGVIALFYLFFDSTALIEQTRFFLSEKTIARLTSLLTRMRSAVGRYVRAYLTILLLTYAELLSGFLILNIDRPYVIALLVALVDVLPVFGVGTVLVPWGVFAILEGEVYRGVGLFVLFAVMYVVRQFVEPRIVGDTIGVHPLFTLFFVFAGFSLFGVWGVFLAPLLLYGIKAIFAGMADEKEELLHS